MSDIWANFGKRSKDAFQAAHPEVDLVLSTPGLSDDQRIAILGGTAARLMGIA